MNLHRFAMPALTLCTLALCIGAAGLSAARAYGQPQGAPVYSYGQERGNWEAPPGELNESQRHGYHDGIEGARRDFENHRSPDVDNRDEFRHPNLPPEFWEAYRDGFRRGYQVAASHLMGGSQQPIREPERADRYMGPEQFSEIQRRGFHEGMEGAQKDVENHRRPDPNNREEYREPRVPRELQDEYREGFRRGYERAMSQLMYGSDRR